MPLLSLYGMSLRIEQMNCQTNAEVMPNKQKSIGTPGGSLPIHQARMSVRVGSSWQSFSQTWQFNLL
jgi:hypothetical protein